MFGSRRQLLLSALATFGTVCVRPRLLADQGPDAPSVSPPRIVERKNPPEPDAATRALQAEQDQKTIRKDVERLFDLATQLKTEVDKMGSASVLSLPLVKKAEEIEKLAKQIKRLSRA